MTPRSIRRATERKAAKLARKAAAPVNADPAAQPDSGEPPCSAAQLAANRANSLLSTGPSTAAGKAISSLNAVKTGLTGRTVLLPSEDAELYERHILAYQNDLHPATLRECELVQSLADTGWRLQRIPGLESAIYAQGRIEFDEAFEAHQARPHPAMIDLQTHLKYEKQLRNLQLQEARLHRRYQIELAELRQLQHDRAEREPAQAAVATALQSQTASASSDGFEFSAATPETQAMLDSLHQMADSLGIFTQTGQASAA